MAAPHNKYIKVIYFVGDIFIINISFFIAYYLVFSSILAISDSIYAFLLLYYNIAWVIVITVMDTYRIYRVNTTIDIINRTFRAFSLYFVVIIAINGINNNISFYTRFFAYSLFMISVSIPLWRVFSVKVIRWYRRQGGNFRRVIIVGKAAMAKEIVNFFNIHPELGYRLYKILEPDEVGEFEGYLNVISNYCKENSIDEIYCTLANFSNTELREIVDCAEKHLVKIKFIPDNIGIGTKSFKIDFYGYIPVFIHRPIPLDEMINRILKRIFDIVFSLIVIVCVLSWLLPLLFILIKINSKGPAFYIQRRSGLFGNHFTCYKLRSMYYEKDTAFVQATANDSRVTNIGKYLRKFNLDELPQFLNVLIGNMSVVGPRPHPIELDNSYKDEIDKYMIRHFVKPGITGLAQVSGYRGETKDPAAMEGRVKLDIFYLENWSFLLDVKIIFYTVFNSMRGDKKAF